MNFQSLKKNFDRIQLQLDAATRAFPWEDKDAYRLWLAQSYEYVRYSTRILALTAGHLDLHQTLMSNRFIQHAAEEKNHDKLLAQDAKALGTAILELPVLAEAEAFHKSLYYWIYQGAPAAILGWVLCLEGCAVRNGPMVFTRAEQAHGTKAASFLKVHSAEDPEHMEKALATLEHLNEEELRQVNHGLELYAQLYMNIFSAIQRQAKTTGYPQSDAA